MTSPSSSAIDKPQSPEIATFGGGCFWCLEAVFEQLKGVQKVESGYAGGQMNNPSYEQVCSGRTGHAEVVQVTFEPQEIPFPDILNAFFATHDPTTLNRQGAAVGMQYRSVGFYHTPPPKEAADNHLPHLHVPPIRDTPPFPQLHPSPASSPPAHY